MTGRKSDMIWKHFKKEKVPGRQGYRAICMYCKISMEGQVARMKSHHAKCNAEKDTFEGEVS